MRWIAPSANDAATATLEKQLWNAADQMRANSGLRSQEYCSPLPTGSGRTRMERSTPSSATRLDPDEADGQLQAHVTTRVELDELEEANIQIGLEWAIRTAITNRRRADVLSEEFLYALHERMFDEVWSWAGQVRRSEKNIGVERQMIRVEVRHLIEDARV